MSDEYPRPVFEGMTPPARDEPAERLLDAMEEADVDRAVVVALSPHDRYLGEVIANYPGTFVGVGVHDFEADDQVGSLRRRVETIGIQGLRLYGLNADPEAEPESLAVFPLLEAMQELDIKAWFYGPPDQMKALDRCLDLLPDLKVVLNHLGFLPDIHLELKVDQSGRPSFEIDLPPPGLELVEAFASKHRSAYVHFSGHYAFSAEKYPYRDLRAVSERILRAFGADRMMMASDWPWIRENPGYGETLGVVDELLTSVTEEERILITGGTAMSLFRF